MFRQAASITCTNCYQPTNWWAGLLGYYWISTRDVLTALLSSTCNVSVCGVSNVQVVARFGEPLKAYGEITRRGRRRFVKYVMEDVE